MKKRAVFILALVMLASLAFGVMPVSAATEYYYSITPIGSGGGHSFEIALASGETIKNDYNYSIVLVNKDSATSATVIGLTYGTTKVNVVNASGTVTKVYNVTVQQVSGGTLADISDSGIKINLDMRMATQHKNIFPTERVTVTAAVTRADNSVVSAGQLRYSWTVTGTGVDATISANANGTASITFNTIPYSAGGTVFSIGLTVYGANGVSKGGTLGSDGAVTGANFTGRVLPSSGTTPIFGGVKAYSGRVTYIYQDRENGNAPLDAGSIGTVATYSNLGRSYTAPVGRSIGMHHYMADASPRTVTFYPEASPAVSEYSIVAGVKKGAGSTAPIAPSLGYVPLPNGYVIFVSVENSNQLTAMAPGDTQQITSAMLGGVSVTAPLMTYKVADPKIAMVSSTGLVTALTTGITSVDVYCNDVKVIVKPLYVLADIKPQDEGLVIKVASVTRTLATQSKVRFRVTAANITFNGKKLAHKDIEWSSSKTSVATVDANGYVRIRAKGACYIYGTYTDKNGDEFTARYKVTVK